MPFFTIVTKEFRQSLTRKGLTILTFQDAMKAETGQNTSAASATKTGASQIFSIAIIIVVREESRHREKKGGSQVTARE